MDTDAVDGQGTPLGHGAWTQDVQGKDPDNYPEALSYTLTGAPSFVTINSSGILKIDVPMGASGGTGGFYNDITVTVSDGDLSYTSVPFDIRVNPNLPPVAALANAGPYVVGVGEPLVLDGSASHDPEHQALGYSWFPVTNGITDPAIVSFTGEDTATPTFLSNVAGMFAAILQVTDPYQSTDPVAVMIQVVGSSPDLSLGEQQATCNGSNPINGGNGNKVHHETDYVSGGPFPLSFRRYYNSFVSMHSLKTTLGLYWRSNYDRTVSLDNTQTPVQAQVHRADGNILVFEQAGGGWQAMHPSITERLNTVSGGWDFIANDDTVEHYDTSGRLVSITTRAGLRQTLTYSGGLLQQVSDGFGRALNFEYNGDKLVEITDAAGTWIVNYSYDAQDNLSWVDRPASPDRQYLYEDSDFPHALTGFRDNGQRLSTYAYDDQGRAISSSHTGGANTVNFVYNADGTTTITDALAQSRTYSYSNEQGRLKVSTITGPQCTSCGGSGQSNTFDANGFPDLTTDFNGNVTDDDYNARGLLEQRIEAVGTPEERTFKTVWHDTYRLPVCAIGPGQTVALDYTANGQLKTQTIYDTTDAALFPTEQSKSCAAIAVRGDVATLNQRRVSYAYYPNSLLKSVDGPRTDVNDITTYIYDAATGNLTQVLNALGQVTTFSQYDVHGRPGRMEDPNGLVTLTTFDLRGRPDTIDVGGEVTDYDYDNLGNLSRVTLPGGSYLQYGYDSAQRLTDISNQLGQSIHYTLDALGNHVATGVDNSTSGPWTTIQSMVFDQENRLQEVQGAVAGEVTEYIDYDANGNLKQLRDPALHDTFFSYDALNRLVTVTDPLNGVTTHTYDVSGNLIRLEDPRGLVTTYQYDGLGNLLEKNSPDSGITAFEEYDAAGNLKRQTDARGVTTVFTYDELNRLTTLTYSDGTTSTAYVYSYDDPLTYGKGRLHRITSDDSTLTYEYDQHGRLVGKAETYGGVTLTVAYRYNSEGQLEAMTTPGGAEISYLYSNGLLNAIQADGNPVISNLEYSYPYFGPATDWDWGNGDKNFRSYDGDGRVVNYTLGNSNRTLSYYPTGLVKDIKIPFDSSHDQNFDYDELLRLKDYTDARTGAHEVYSYDATGNRTSVTEGTTSPVTYDSPIDPVSNRLQNTTGPTPKTYSYDAIGNITGDGTYAFGYDLRGRLTQVTPQGTPTNALTYVINPLGQRISKQGSQAGQAGDFNSDGHIDSRDITTLKDQIIAGDATSSAADCTGDSKLDVLDAICLNNQLATSGPSDRPYSASIRFAYDAGGHLSGEYEQDGTPIQEFVWFNGKPIAILQGTERYYVYTDHLNTPRVVTNQANVEVWRWDSDPFGKAAPDADPDGDGGQFVFNLRFPGQYYDQETGLHYNAMRDYDPATGRYLQSDPIGLAGGLNTYAYVNGNPLNASDPRGLFLPVVLYEGAVLVTEAVGGACARNPGLCVSIAAAAGKTAERFAEDMLKDALASSGSPDGGGNTICTEEDPYGWLSLPEDERGRLWNDFMEEHGDALREVLEGFRRQGPPSNIDDGYGDLDRPRRLCQVWYDDLVKEWGRIDALEYRGIASDIAAQKLTYNWQVEIFLTKCSRYIPEYVVEPPKFTIDLFGSQ